MIENYTFDSNTKEVTGIFDGVEFSLPPKIVNQDYVVLSEQECLEILETRKQAALHTAATTYQVERASAYPSIADQLDTIYHEGIDAWKAQIAAVKQEYPKP